LDSEQILLTGVSQNNLKHIDVGFPTFSMSVITGPSGSGKSSLAFETLYAESQRRFIESLNTYTRQFIKQLPKPDVESISTLAPAIALEQRNTVNNSRSTVSSLTEIADHLRVLYVRAANQICSLCEGEIEKVSPSWIHDWLLEHRKDRRFYIGFRASSSDLQSGLMYLPARGFSRALINRNKEWQPLRLDPDEEIKGLKAREKEPRRKLWSPGTKEALVVVDRVQLNDRFLNDQPNRLMEAIETSISESAQNEVIFYFPDDSKEPWIRFEVGLRCKDCGQSAETFQPNHLSPNSPIGACALCNGFGKLLELDESKVVPDPELSISSGAINPFEKPSMRRARMKLKEFCRREKIPKDLPWKKLSQTHREQIWQGKSQGKNKFEGIVGIFEHLKEKRYKFHVRIFIRRYQGEKTCPECKGSRLNQRARLLRLGSKGQSKDIVEFQDLSIARALEWIEKMKLNEEQKKIAEEPFLQIKSRLKFLHEVGLGYLSLGRKARTLSGGESQRIHLANQLGARLCGTLYVLDEPTIGLHAQDVKKMLGVLESLRDLGNTVVLVEHDPAVIYGSDHVIELGPGSGEQGGKVVFKGSQKVFRKEDTLTSESLRAYGKKVLAPPEEKESKRIPGKARIKLKEASIHNLNKFSVELPLYQMVGLCGVSGSGKSTLMKNALYEQLVKLKESEGRAELLFSKSLKGWEKLSSIHMIDQKPVGKNSRSNPVTFMKAYDDIRRIFSDQRSARKAGLHPKHFSFNVDGGRCPVCKGEGEILIEMHFLEDMKVRCDVCRGKRFQKQILKIRYQKKNIDDVLHLTVNESIHFFKNHQGLVRKLECLRAVGLGYLRLGQSATTLSGGESQRLKIASVLDSQSVKDALYFFDEPTTGLHLQDVEVLLEVFQELVNRGASLVIIEHHLGVLRESDWLIELGPGGGEAGGLLVDQGRPEELQERCLGPTGQALYAEETSYRVS
jgi:excinuclease ABC subunit A